MSKFRPKRAMVYCDNCLALVIIILVLTLMTPQVRGNSEDVDKCATNNTHPDWDELWDHYKQHNSRDFNSVQEPKRRAAWAQSQGAVFAHNQLFSNGQRTFELEMNDFADWAPADYQQLLGLRINSAGRARRRRAAVAATTAAATTTNPSTAKPTTTASTTRPTTAATTTKPTTAATTTKPTTAATTTKPTTAATTTAPTACPVATGLLPPSLNYVTLGRVTVVQNQGRCGSCWAFSAVAAIEGQLYCKTNKLIKLSEQEVVDCSASNLGCNGGDEVSAFLEIGNIGGIENSTMYPYTAVKSTCKYNAKYKVASVTGYQSVQPNNETALMYALYTLGPLSVAIDASGTAFQLYKSGVYTSTTCRNGISSLNHAVLLVGYGTTTVNGVSVPYWLVKNSWGTSWGMNGYIMMAKDKNNMCGIATYAHAPTVAV